MSEIWLSSPFKEWAQKYWDASYSVIPGKYGAKTPLKGLVGWTKYGESLPSKEEQAAWLGLDIPANLDLCLGRASGVVALDLDCEDVSVLDIILPLIPDSLVEKRGAKGFTRFFQYKGESSGNVLHNGKVVLEVLSNKKKTTLPPSKHPEGMDYVWTGKALVEVDKTELPLLPPFLLSHLSFKLKMLSSFDFQGSNGGSSGRNLTLSSLCGKLIGENRPIHEAVALLLEEDSKHEIPLFTDHGEFGHGERYTNVLRFYSNHLNTVNSKRFLEHKIYVEPTFIKTFLDAPPKVENRAEPCLTTPLPALPGGPLKDLYEVMLQNSFIPQPSFSLGASLVFMGVLIGRKFSFMGAAPNLYVLNLGPSGCGKDAPQVNLKRMMENLKANHLVGSGDYVSDASLMDQLPFYPSRLDIIDEASGILKSIARGGAPYSQKMGEVLCELYTSSSSVFSGRMTAQGVRGFCVRPNVNLLCSTNPTSFSRAVTAENLESGLLGRFLIFNAIENMPSRMIKEMVPVPEEAIEYFTWLKNFSPSKGIRFNNDFYVESAEIGPKEEEYLTHVFEKYDRMRQEMDKTDILLPLVARLFQLLCKISLISAAANPETRESRSVIIREEDVRFADDVVKYHFAESKKMITSFLHKSSYEKIYTTVFNIIRGVGIMTTQELHKKLKFLKPREREEIIHDLVKTGAISIEMSREGKQLVVLSEKEY